MKLYHPQVAESKMTCFACPEQYEGKLTDGRWFYFRYRFGRATLALGCDYDSVMGEADVGIPVGDNLQGVFEDEEQRERAFADLLLMAAGEER